MLPKSWNPEVLRSLFRIFNDFSMTYQFVVKNIVNVVEMLPCNVLPPTNMSKHQKFPAMLQLSILISEFPCSKPFPPIFPSILPKSIYAPTRSIHIPPSLFLIQKRSLFFSGGYRCMLITRLREITSWLGKHFKSWMNVQLYIKHWYWIWRTFSGQFEDTCFEVTVKITSKKLERWFIKKQNTVAWRYVVCWREYVDLGNHCFISIRLVQ